MDGVLVNFQSGIDKLSEAVRQEYEVMDEVLELLLDLDATDEQFNSPTVFCSGRAPIIPASRAFASGMPSSPP